ncbi:MAG: OmpA family protein [Verrucomicrobiota bacterium]
MADNANPFAKPAGPRSGPGNIPLPWIAGGAFLLIAAAFITWAAFQQQLQRTQRAGVEAEKAREQLGKARAEAADLRSQLDAAKSRIAELENEKEMAAQMHRSLEDEMKSELESKDVTISQLQGRLTVNILDRVLFDSGEAILKPDGESVLRKVAAILTQHPTLNIQVIGHTDNIPIRPGARTKFASNWELSTGRALAAVRFLTEIAGVDPRRVAAVGSGEYRPLADNSTPEGRARNRRIAITVLPPELASADAVTAPATNAPAAP